MKTGANRGKLSKGGYYRAFSTLDVQAILPYCHELSFIVIPQGVAAMPTHAALVAWIAPCMEAFRARGFARSELTMLQLKRLSAGTALAAGVAVRYKTYGQELDGTWKIAVIVVYDADSRPLE